MAPRSLAEVCFEHADGDPELALVYALDVVALADSRKAGEWFEPTLERVRQHQCDLYPPPPLPPYR